MYPHVTQFETRFQNAGDRLYLAEARRPAARAGRARRRRPRSALRLGGTTAAFA
jgi:hypothetical protein